MKDSDFPLSIQASILIGALVIAVAILTSGGVIKLYGMTPTPSGSAQQPQVTPQPSTSPQKYNVSAGNLPTLGGANAKVLVVEWADYQCPFCKQYFQNVEAQLKKDYIDSGKIKYAFRDFPFLGQASTDPAGDESVNSANATRCANEQGKFWDYHDYLYNHQGQENQGAFSKDNLKKFAQALSLNTDQFNGCVDSNKYNSDVTKDLSAGRTVGVNGTPTVYVNGVQIVGSQPYDVFKTEIDKALTSSK